jgi:hypothetical protein
MIVVSSMSQARPTQLDPEANSPQLFKEREIIELLLSWAPYGDRPRMTLLSASE